MKSNLPDYCNTERSVEIVFACEKLRQYCQKNTTILDVGGIPTNNFVNKPIIDTINQLKKEYNIEYDINDFRGGKFKGDFISHNFGEYKFDIIIFLSSLEHFPQCTEGDRIYRDGEDIKGFKKALSLLNNGGYILLTIPMGKAYWDQKHYERNYDMAGVMDLSKGSEIIEKFIYTINTGKKEWALTDPKFTEHLEYTDRCYCVGCFVFKKIV